MTGLAIVNGTAERFIKTLTDQIGTVKIELCLLDTLLTVEEFQRLAEKSKGALSPKRTSKE